MPYTADISRANPTCFLLLLDQSGSMTQTLGGQPGQRKMYQAANAINGILDAISLRCSQGMEIRDYFHIGVITYTTNRWGSSTVRSAFPGTSLDRPFLLISQVVDLAEVEERQVRESDGAGGLVEVTRRAPVWVRPVAERGTPMRKALAIASQSLRNWIYDHPESFPPTVINITDGASTDGNPEPKAQEIMALGTNDGNALLFNIHLSGVTAMPVQYPDKEDGLTDDLAKRLFRMSSVLPESCRQLAPNMDLPVTEHSRGFVFNSDMDSLVDFLEIGTRGPTNLH